MGADQSEGRPDMGRLYASYRQDAPGALLYRKPEMRHISLNNADGCRLSQTTLQYPFEDQQDGRVAASRAATRRVQLSIL